MRLEFISKALEHYGFETEIRGDMLLAFSSRLDSKDTAKQLAVLGYLMAVTRLMDMRLENSGQVDAELAKFVTVAEGIDV